VNIRMLHGGKRRRRMVADIQERGMAAFDGF
jgi:hypothetical protein